jgi:DTW domain-containing protein YfiP
MVTRTHFLICMHPREWRHQKTGTGRMLHLGLRHSTLVVSESPGSDPAVRDLMQNPGLAAHLVYPGAQSIDLAGGQKPELGGRLLLSILLDGTWRQARRMMKLSPEFHTLPRLSFIPQNPSAFRIKRQPEPHCLSTIEAAVTLMATLKGLGLEDAEGSPLFEEFQKMVRFQESFMPGPKSR